MLIINKKVKNMQNIILSVIALENVNDSQKLALIKEICEKLSNSRNEEEKALKLCGEFQSDLTYFQDQINDLKSDIDDHKSDIDDLESSFEDLQNDFDNLEVDGGAFEELESKMGDLESSMTGKLYFLTKLLIKKGVINEEEIIAKKEVEKEEVEKEIPNNN